MIEESLLETHLENLTDDYHDGVATLDQPPSAIEALRMINRSQPVIIKDSVRTLTDGSTTFVKPLEEHMSMGTFLSRLTDGEQEIHYLQSQDGNIYRSTPGARGPPDLADFQPFIERDTVWMKEATGYSAEAVNLWIGASRSTTSLHHDPYENIYHVLSGSKTFTLVSPIDGLRIEPPDVPWVEGTDIPAHARHTIVTLNEGDSLYLPANWWHRPPVKEEADEPSWYTSEIRPEFYAFERFARRIARSAGREVLPVDIDEVDEAVWGSEVDSADEWDPSEWGR
ncbi:hypothetical protein A1Q1_01925 [Trichosporon asahii var. asahii CBS 2479]|uniref:JmjC domain-containing protein n=1 Tax=Trichosporon asahii var. asahii (strain ATCC 90039 / CBS 2479 / JCM 2466 / KCTC 7840 / NBRC 103889/ NCYC 2677 / UAMH 7654) TaxID=1186058 RepID=J6EWN9_TRIAS|nr:hypothetical protein A1Q1_01925 [Trichosporon asahii var. asahii CBS 2479]EJT49014.1 hypothetical protein A1Q1_01925 [Trichosporon asahii var. asahii CBS 2479]